jgi:tetratricopeptide (TPR) repeat protein
LLLVFVTIALLSGFQAVDADSASSPPADSSVNTNTAMQAAYRKVLLDDDAAQQDVLKWADDAQSFAKAGGGYSGMTLDARIQERLKGIKAEYDDLIQHYPNFANARLAYGSFLNDIHDEEGAVEQWEKARVLAPTNPAPWNNLANYYAHRSPIKKAFEYYGNAIELDSHEAVYYQNLAVSVYLFRSDAEAYYHLNETQVFDKALALYRQAIALDPDNFPLFSDYAESFYGTKPPRWKDGLAAWTEALKIAHDDTEREGVYIHLARINLKLGNFDAARRSLNQVTNSGYDVLKKRITRNLNEAIAKAATNSPAK